MAKKKNWFNLLKRLFISEPHSKLEKDKRRRWVFGKLKKRKLTSISAPLNLSDGQQKETEGEQRRDATNVTTEASDAVLKATETAAETICRACKSQSVLQVNETTEKNFDIPVPHNYVHEREIQVLAAIKIQTAFRGYLARKALRALKGVVRLQAIIRGRAVRRQAITTLKCLQTIVNIHSEVCAKRCEMGKSTSNCSENMLEDLREKDIKIDLNSQKRWDDSLLSKEEANVHVMSKREAEIKRERIKEYWLSHRRSAETEQNRINARRRYWLEQWVDAQLAKREDFHKDAVNSSKSRSRDHLVGRQLKLKKFQKEYYAEGLESAIHVPRRSFHRKQRSTGDDSSFVESSVVPTYMAATESAKAKTRSMSSPRLRPINIDTYSEINSPYKHRLSPISSINSEATSISRIVNPIGLSQRSPCLKGLPGPIKSTRSLKDLSLNSDVSLPTWEHYGVNR